MLTKALRCACAEVLLSCAYGLCGRGEISSDDDSLCQLIAGGQRAAEAGRAAVYSFQL